jgi:hypothetical protein
VMTSGYRIPQNRVKTRIPMAEVTMSRFISMSYW